MYHKSLEQGNVRINGNSGQDYYYLSLSNKFIPLERKRVLVRLR